MKFAEVDLGKGGQAVVEGDDDGTPYGILWNHKTADETECAAYVSVRGPKNPKAVHAVTSREPLVVLPSVVCPVCTLHGFIGAEWWERMSGGRWVRNENGKGNRWESTPRSKGLYGDHGKPHWW